MAKSSGVVLVGFVLLVSGVLDAAGSSPSPAPYASTHILVRLEEKIAGRNADGSYSLSALPEEISTVVREGEIYRIEHALPVTMQSPRKPELLARHGLDRTYKFFVSDAEQIPAMVERFSALPGVELAEPDYLGQGGATVPNDPLFSPDQWSLSQLSDADVDAPEAWDVTTGSDGIVIAVLDTGIDSDHPDLIGKIVAGFDFVNVDADPEDDHGHGTNVASIVTVNTDNAQGIAGACWHCRIMPVKTLDQNNSGFYSWWADGMVWATDNGADLINMSSGGFSPSATLLAGVEYAYDAGVVHVSITHNDNASSVRYPGAYAQPLTVGATDEIDHRVEPFCWGGGSNYGPGIDVSAPGDLILGAAVGGGYNSWCGTSQAAPHVAGLIGLMMTLYPAVGREETVHLVAAGAEDLVGQAGEDRPGFDYHHGWGRINMHRTLLGTEASITLRVDGKTVTRPFFDTPNPLAASYDFVRGDLSALSESDAGVTLGNVVCLEDDSLDADTLGNEDAATPAPGQGFFYLSRFEAAPGPGHYGGSTRNRDRFPTGGDCTP